MADTGRVVAVLGPTNTGKTHYAIERMLAHRSGIIGLPLRLLAREVYDRIVAARGPSVVALVTGEERIVPPRVQYWVATVEAMPEGTLPDFLAVDEIQLCADPERGHVFTDRLLHARGRHETLFMGSETMRPAIAALVPRVTFQSRERYSTLTFTGARKLSRMPERSAIVGFSVENVYAIAELLRRTKGGAAVVMGALSPRTRNAQVAMYQRGEVDYLVATDAIGMGLNLDIAHVAFSAIEKFDGRRWRQLAADELAQIAGRAGRYQQPGTFGLTGEVPGLEDETIAAIEQSAFRPVARLQWRNADLRFGTVAALIASLEARTDNPWLTRVRESDDLSALKTLAGDPAVAARTTDARGVRLLWDVCRIPDFRGISRGEHAALLTRIFTNLFDLGHVDGEWFAAQVERIDRADGNIDQLSRRLAYIRTWTYVAQRTGWLAQEDHWREQTRAVEDRLSDALHAALTQAFVDRRTSVLARRLRQKESLVADVNDKGEVSVDGELLGRLEGFRFRADRTASVDEAKTLARAAREALAPHLSLRADRFYNAPDTEIDFTDQGGLMWGELAVGRLTKGPEPLKPQVLPFVDEEVDDAVREKVARRLQHFIDRRIAAAMEPLTALSRDETLDGQAKGFGYRLVEHFGVIPRGEVAAEVKALDQAARGALRKHGVRFGQFTVFLPALLKPAPTRLRLVLWGLSRGLDEFPESPPPGLVTMPTPRGVEPGYFAMAGYRAAGERSIRIDMLERLADMLRDRDARGGFEATPDMLSITGLTLDQFAQLMEGLGYSATRGERPKLRAAGDVPEPSTPGPDVPAPEPSPGAPDSPPETPDPGAPDLPPPDGVPEGPDVPVPEPTPTEPDLPDEQPGNPGIPAPEPSPVSPPEPQEVPPPPAEVPPAPPLEVPPASPAEMPPSTPGEMPPTIAGAPAEGEETASAAAAEPATEVFYTFVWGNRRAERREQRGRAGGGARPAARDGDAPRGKGQGKGKGKPRGKPAERVEAAPPKPRPREKRIDPDNPFAAALAGFKTK